jgi:hypothetical protein
MKDQEADVFTLSGRLWGGVIDRLNLKSETPLEIYNLSEYTGSLEFSPENPVGTKIPISGVRGAAFRNKPYGVVVMGSRYTENTKEPLLDIPDELRGKALVVENPERK